MTYTLHEPFPHYQPSAPMPFGRGGAGNHTKNKAPEKRNKLPPSTLTSAAGHEPQSQYNTTSSHRSSNTPQKFITVDKSHAHPGPNYSTGRGGAGNMHDRGEERAMFVFDEELERERRLSKNPAPVYHVGRGGGGNVVGKRRGSETGSEGSGKSSARHSLDIFKRLGK